MSHMALGKNDWQDWQIAHDGTQHLPGFLHRNMCAPGQPATLGRFPAQPQLAKRRRVEAAKLGVQGTRLTLHLLCFQGYVRP